MGSKIGHVSTIYTDGDNADWAVVLGKPLENGAALVPLTDAALEGEAIVVPYERDVIDGSPDVPHDERPSAELVGAVAAYYREQLHAPRA
jgi:hypothetical protein